MIRGLINNENLLGNPRVNLIRISWSGQGVIHHTWASRELNSWKREPGMKRFLGNVLCLKVTGWWKVKVYHTLNTEYSAMAQARAGAFLQSQLMIKKEACPAQDSLHSDEKGKKPFNLDWFINKVIKWHIDSALFRQPTKRLLALSVKERFRETSFDNF